MNAAENIQGTCVPAIGSLFLIAILTGGYQVNDRDYFKLKIGLWFLLPSALN